MGEPDTTPDQGLTGTGQGSNSFPDQGRFNEPDKTGITIEVYLLEV